MRAPLEGDIGEQRLHHRVIGQLLVGRAAPALVIRGKQDCLERCEYEGGLLIDLVLQQLGQLRDLQRQEFLECLASAFHRWQVNPLESILVVPAAQVVQKDALTEQVVESVLMVLECIEHHL